MFKVVEKETGKVFTVYGIKNNEFLIHSNDFKWVYMNKFRPFLEFN